MRIIRKYWALLLLPFFLNCATHAPMSEMVMFSPKKVPSKSLWEKDSVNVYYSRFSSAISGEVRTINPEIVQKYASQKFGNHEKGTADYTTVGAMSVNAMFLFRNQADVAFNVSIFPTFGYDGTIRIAKQYFTFAHTVYGGQQYILQRRLVYNDHSGLSAGIFYEHFWQGYNSNEPVDCSLCGFGPDEEYYLDMIGVRATGLIHDGMKNRVFVKGNIKLGYIPVLKTASLGVGCSVGMF